MSCIYRCRMPVSVQWNDMTVSESAATHTHVPHCHTMKGRGAKERSLSELTVRRPPVSHSQCCCMDTGQAHWRIGRCYESLVGSLSHSAQAALSLYQPPTALMASNPLISFASIILSNTPSNAAVHYNADTSMPSKRCTPQMCQRPAESVIATLSPQPIRIFDCVRPTLRSCPYVRC